MSRAKDELIKDLTDKFGPQARPMIDYLFDMGTCDDVLARRHVIKFEVFKRMRDTNIVERVIHEQVADEYSVTRECVYQLVNPSYQKAG